MKFVGGIVLVAMLVAAGPASAQKLDLSTIKCKEFFEGKKEDIAFVMMWLLGYYADQDDPPVVDFGKMKDRIEKLAVYCARNPGNGLITAADEVME
jgi:acid stress chaperone HdeB